MNCEKELIQAREQIENLNTSLLEDKRETLIKIEKIRKDHESQIHTRTIDFERKMIRERQMEGIRIRKEKGLYKGRQIGSVETPMMFLQKTKSQNIMKDLRNGYTIREITEMRKCSFSTINKVKRLMETTDTQLV